ncbi:MAG TPA: serine hydrolase domain-containing protein [Methylomirabilota bacterium]
MRRLALVAALLVAVGAAEARAEPTGSALPGLGAYDELMTALIKKWDVPGAGLAVAYHGKLLLARGYGLASKERFVAVAPTSLFRLASLSKTVTAVTVLRLVQDGRLKLDTRVLPLLGDIGPRADRITDVRVRDITVRHLLQHSGGFDRERSGDAVFLPGAADAAQRQNGPLPPDCPTIMRDALERTLDFTPGERFAYSNVGYCILGRVIEKVTGVTYETYVREHVLGPVGATRMRIGRTLQPAEGEVRYYDYRGAKEVKAMPGLGLKFAPQPYGAFAVETMDSYGGWIGAPIDYLRFVLAIDGRRGPALLNAETLAEMNAPSGLHEKTTAEDGNADGVSYGLGIRIRRVRNGANLFHTGSIPGTSTLAVRSADGFAWVVAFNSRPQDRNGFRGEVDRGLWIAKGRVKRWPAGDLFDRNP